MEHGVKSESCLRANIDCTIRVWDGRAILHDVFLPNVPRLSALSDKVVSTFWPVLVAGSRALTPRLALDTIAPVLVLGNQKTGSTAIAELLAHRGQLRAATDLHPLQSATVQVENDPASAARLVQRLRYYFRRDLVKENELTAATDALLEVLPRARPVFVVRHPVHNIRSILDRLALPGRPRPFSALPLSGDGWERIVRGRDYGIEADDHITALALRWVRTTAMYRRHPDRLHLVRYEDFVADKLSTINTLAAQLGIEPKADIRPLLDVPFQPRGDHRATAPRDFFSERALAIIHDQCADGMDALHYEPILDSSAS